MVIAGFVLLQILVPLSYYTLRDNPYDERFAWRMFSAIRVHRCQIAAFEEGAGGRTEIALPKTIHRGWINIMKRNRRGAIDAFLDSRCALPERTKVVVQNRCISEARQPIPERQYILECGQSESRVVEEGQ